jgi:cGMP-dependent protein kinase 1
VGSVVLILDALEKRNIIHRDVKPDNFIVDKDGYITLFDFSIATICNEKDERAKTIIGSPHYMAPEVVLGKEYDNMVDYWALGICLYEFMCG